MHLLFRPRSLFSTSRARRGRGSPRGVSTSRHTGISSLSPVCLRMADPPLISTRFSSSTNASSTPPLQDPVSRSLDHSRQVGGLQADTVFDCASHTVHSIQLHNHGLRVVRVPRGLDSFFSALIISSLQSRLGNPMLWRRAISQHMLLNPSIPAEEAHAHGRVGSQPSAWGIQTAADIAQTPILLFLVGERAVRIFQPIHIDFGPQLSTLALPAVPASGGARRMAARLRALEAAITRLDPTVPHAALVLSSVPVPPAEPLVEILASRVMHRLKGTGRTSICSWNIVKARSKGIAVATYPRVELATLEVV